MIQGELIPAAIQIQQVSRFSGPIPPPRLLSEYDQVLPGLADRLVMLAEGEAAQRHALQLRRVRLAEAGLASAFVIAMSTIFGGIYLIHEGSTREGLGGILAAVAALLVVYLTRGRKSPAPQVAGAGEAE
ncbi:MAG TPA: DUF2335 domain-containing protein [Longimicrobiaceae bacterium]|nr:DUF2335 domain-containing protein [Longimicrobiaceae bacterium]